MKALKPGNIREFVTFLLLGLGVKGAQRFFVK
jgi:hypothetical protein